MITDITRSKKLYPKYLPPNKTTSINKKLTMRYVSFDIVELVFYQVKVTNYSKKPCAPNLLSILFCLFFIRDFKSLNIIIKYYE